MLRWIIYAVIFCVVCHHISVPLERSDLSPSLASMFEARGMFRPAPWAGGVGGMPGAAPGAAVGSLPPSVLQRIWEGESSMLSLRPLN